MSRFHDLFGAGPVLIGMIHLPPLPDYPSSPGQSAIDVHAVNDLHTLMNGGFDGVLVENEHDRPHRVEATPATVSAMTQATSAVVNEWQQGIVGCEILLNDPRASLDVAVASGAQFIRTDYYVDRMTRPGYGEFEIDPKGLLAYRRSIGADEVLILADIQVKYATMVEPRPLAESARLAIDAGADAVVVTGDASGDAPLQTMLRDAAQGAPVLIGSGLSPVNAADLLNECDGAIVGTALMKDGAVCTAAVDELMIAAGRR